MKPFLPCFNPPSSFSLCSSRRAHSDQAEHSLSPRLQIPLPSRPQADPSAPSPFPPPPTSRSPQAGRRRPPSTPGPPPGGPAHAQHRGQLPPTPARCRPRPGPRPAGRCLPQRPPERGERAAASLRPSVPSRAPYPRPCPLGGGRCRPRAGKRGSGSGEGRSRARS